MIKVLHFIDKIGLGGTERNLENLTKLLDKDKFQSIVCGFSSSSERGDILRESGYVVYNCDGDINKLVSIIKDDSIDAFLFYRDGRESQFWNLVLDRVKQSKVKVIIEMNNFGLVDSGPCSKFINLHMHVSKSSYYKFKRAKGKWTKKDKRTNFVCYPILDTCDIKRSINEIKISDYKHRYGIKNDDFILSRVARPDLIKWTELTTFSLLLILRKNKHIKFIVRAIPKEREHLFKILFKNQVILLPQTLEEKDILSTYKVSDVLFHFSKIGESFGYCLVESLLCSVPVITYSTPKGDNAQIEIITNGQTGIIPKGGPISIAKIVLDLTKRKDILEKMGRQGEEEMRKNSDSERIANVMGEFMLLFIKNSTNLEEFYSKIKLSKIIFPSIKEIEDFEQEYENRLKDRYDPGLNIIERIIDSLLLNLVTIIDKTQSLILIIRSKFG